MLDPGGAGRRLDCSPTIFGESGTTRSSGAGLASARSVRTAPATAPFTNRNVPRLALLVRLPAADGDENAGPVGGGGDVGLSERRDLAPAHPGHEEQLRDDGIEAAALEGDLVGLDASAAPARLAAGAEDGGEVRRHERSRWPPSSTACRPPVAGEDPGLSVSRPGSGRRRGGPGSTPRPPPSPSTANPC